jgi:uncharacterized phosphosugar-binding protein
MTTTDRPGRTYLRSVLELTERVLDQEWESIADAARLVADSLTARREVHAFGTGHSHMLAEELYYRAGGLVDIRPLLFEGLMLHADAPLSTRLERLPGLASTLLDEHGVHPGDVMFIFSNSGRNAVTIELATEVKARGAAVVAVTSVRHSRSTAPRVGTKLLMELADVVIDNGGVPGDAVVELEGLDRAVAPTSTAVGAAIANAIVAEACALMLERGIVPRIFASSNLDSGDVVNARLLGGVS